MQSPISKYYSGGKQECLRDPFKEEISKSSFFGILEPVKKSCSYMMYQYLTGVRIAAGAHVYMQDSPITLSQTKW